MHYEDTPEFWREFAYVLCRVVAGVANELQPFLGAAGAEVVGTAHSDDILSRADEVASMALRSALGRIGLPLALLDEKHGILEPLSAEAPVIGVIADELDGTRPFRMHCPTACVSAAAWPLDVPATMRNVRCAVIVRLDTREAYVLVGGRLHRVNTLGTQWQELVPPQELKKTPLHDARLYADNGITSPALHGLYLQPFQPNIKMGMLSLASICYGGVLMMERGVDALLHLAYREWEAWPEARPGLERIWGGMRGLQTYDIAALAPMLVAARFTVTDAWGRPLDDLRIDRSGSEYTVSGLIAATSAELHAQVLASIERQEARMIANRGCIRHLLFS